MWRSRLAPTQLARRNKSVPSHGFFLSLQKSLMPAPSNTPKVSTPCAVCTSGGLEGETESQRTVTLPWRKQERIELQEIESAS